MYGQGASTSDHGITYIKTLQYSSDCSVDISAIGSIDNVEWMGPREAANHKKCLTQFLFNV